MTNENLEKPFPFTYTETVKSLTKLATVHHNPNHQHGGTVRLLTRQPSKRHLT